MKFKRYYLATALGLLVAMPLSNGSIVLAQDSEEADDDVETIVVTARKVEENIQEVPVSVSVLTADELIDGAIYNIEDASRKVAGFVFDTPFGRQFDRPIIRGQANILGASGVSVFIDGVNVAHSIRSLNFGDIEQMEIIKGPQSALFGRNTYSGAINITTRKPTNEFKSDLTAEFGQYGHQQLLLNFSGPLAQDAVYYNLSYRSYDFDSEFDNSSNENPSVGNESSRTFSASIKAMLSDALEVNFRFATNTDDDGHFPIGLLGFDDLNINVPGGTYLNSNQSQAQPFYSGEVPTEDPNPSGSEQISDTLGEGGGIERDDSYFSINADLALPNGGSLHATYGQNEEEFRDELDSDGQPGEFANARIFGPFPLGPPGAPFGVGIVPFDFTTNDDDLTETSIFEMRYDSDVDMATRWRAGFFIYQSDKTDRSLAGRFEGGENNRYYQAARNSWDQAHREVAQALGRFFVVPLVSFSYGPSNPIDSETTNNAFFASISQDFNDQMTVSLEVRQATEEITQETHKIYCEPDPSDPDDDCGTTFVQNEEFTAFTPRVTLDYQMTDTRMFYGIISTGTKPGGFNNEASQLLGFGSFLEEDALVFEAGMKSSFNNGLGIFNFTFFRSIIDGYQLTENLAALGATGTVGSATANLGEVAIFGIETEMTYSPPQLANVVLGGNYAYTNAEFTEGSENTHALVYGDGNLDGQQVPRQTPHQLVLFMDYDFTFGADADGTFSIDSSYMASRYAQVQNLAETGASFEVGAKLAMRFDNGRYSLTVWGKNLLDDDSPLGVLRFIDALGVNSFQIGPSPLPSTFQLASAGQSRGFQYNNRNGRRFGMTLRLKM